jgi:hypothetical protein
VIDLLNGSLTVLAIVFVRVERQKRGDEYRENYKYRSTHSIAPSNCLHRRIVLRKKRLVRSKLQSAREVAPIYVAAETTSIASLSGWLHKQQDATASKGVIQKKRLRAEHLSGRARAENTARAA